MALDAELRYLISVQDRDLKRLQTEIRQTNKALGTETEQAATKGSKGLGRFGGAAKVAGAALLGGLALGAKAGFAELKEGQKVAAQTEAVLKSTGGAAKVTGKEIEGLAGRLSRLSGVDDEVIQSGQNMLLTFKNIRNEAGKGNDIFNRSTEALLDMSVAMGKDPQTQAIQLGKALNDPVKGMSALGRAGVQFTEEQKATIKSLVRSGDVMGAQKLILGELETQFGGSAKAAGETMGGQLNKATNSLEEMAASLMQTLVPALTVGAQWLGKGADFLSKHTTLAKFLVGGVAALAIGLMALNTALTVHAFVTKVATEANKKLMISMLTNPVFLVVAGLVALGIALVVAYKKSEKFRAIVDGAFSAVKEVAGGVVELFSKDLPGAIEGTVDWVRAHWPEIATLLSGPFAPLVALATDAFGIRSALTGALGALKDVVFEKAKAVGGAVKDGVRTVAWEIPQLLFDRIIQPILDKVTVVFEKAKSLSEQVPKGIKTVFWGLAEVFDDRIAQPLRNLIETVKGVGGNIARGIRDGIRDTLIEIKQTVVGAFEGFVNAIIGVLNKVPFVDIPKLAQGSIVRGPTLAMVGEDGPEAVIPLSRKRRRRGQELLTQAAKLLGVPGDLPGPYVRRAAQLGIPMLANGALVSGAGNPLVTWLEAGVLRARANPTLSIFEEVKKFAAGGLASLVSSLPTPSFGNSHLNALGTGVRDWVADALRGLFERKATWLPDKIIEAKYWAERQLGKPYIWGGGHGPWNYNLAGYDCSGFSSHAAKLAGAGIGGPGTTMSLYPISRAGSDAVTWGFRGMSSGSPRQQHMGTRILGDWYQFGDPGRKGGGDSQWDHLRIPPGLPGYQQGVDYVPRTGPALLHRGERVVPAEQNRPGPLVHISSVVVRRESDIDAIAAAISRKLAVAGVRA